MIKKLICILLLITSSLFLGAKLSVENRINGASVEVASTICKRVAQACINLHQVVTLCDNHGQSYVIKATPLHYRIAANRMKDAKHLVKLGADLSMVDHGGLTPIHLAVYLGYRDVSSTVSFLCSTQKAKKRLSIMDDIKDSSGRSAMELLWQLKYRSERNLHRLNKELLPVTYQNRYNRLCAITDFIETLYQEFRLLHCKQKIGSVEYDKASDMFDQYHS